MDFALIDGWPRDEEPSLAREVIEIVAPQLRVGGYVMNDNAEPDFLEFIRDPLNGFISITLPSGFVTVDLKHAPSSPPNRPFGATRPRSAVTVNVASSYSTR